MDTRVHKLTGLIATQSSQQRTAMKMVSSVFVFPEPTTMLCLILSIAKRKTKAEIDGGDAGKQQMLLRKDL